jgi:hypothetical protein
MEIQTMKRITLCIALLGALGMGAFTTAPAEASAPSNWHGVVSIANTTNTTLKYLFRWGDGAEWQVYTLEPGEHRWHAWKYDYANENRSPTPQVAFDADMTDGIRIIDHNLTAYAAPLARYEYSKKYVFREHGCDAIKLVGVN